jgi:hypothetical protein
MELSSADPNFTYSPQLDIGKFFQQLVKHLVEQNASFLAYQIVHQIERTTQETKEPSPLQYYTKQTTFMYHHWDTVQYS